MVLAWVERRLVFAWVEVGHPALDSVLVEGRSASAEVILGVLSVWVGRFVLVEAILGEGLSV